MTALDESDLFRPRTRLRRLEFWMALVALVLLLVGLWAVALPDSISGAIVWAFNAEHGLRQADVIGAVLLTAGSALIWITGLTWQWLYTR